MLSGWKTKKAPGVTGVRGETGGRGADVQGGGGRAVRISSLGQHQRDLVETQSFHLVGTRFLNLRGK